MATVTANPLVDPETQSLSTRQLLTRLIETVSLLVTKEIELVRAEIKADLKAEIATVALLVAAGVVAVFGVTMLLVAAIFALTVWMPGWLAALAIAALLFAVGGVLALVGWTQRVSVPLAVTRRTVKEDVEWARDRLA
jgi:predicted phage tail protein